MAVVKIIELVGSSKTSTDDAAKQALTEAQSSLRNIRAVDIVSTGIRGENLDEYRAHVRVAFIVDQADVAVLRHVGREALLGQHLGVEGDEQVAAHGAVGSVNRASVDQGCRAGF